jgi:hypothetical protein
MNLLSRARNLLASGRLSAISAIAIAPLATAVSDAAITFGAATQSASSALNMGNASSGASISKNVSGYYITNTGGTSYDFSLNVGDYSDSAIFGTVLNSTRSGTISLSGACSGSLDANQALLFTYTISTSQSGGYSYTYSTSVTYTAYVTLCDESGTLYSVGTTTLGTNDLTGDLTLTQSSTGTDYTWNIEIGYDWNIDNYLLSGYSDDDYLTMIVSGSITVVSVPETASWGFAGAAGALGAAMLAGRKKKLLSQRQD